MIDMMKRRSRTCNYGKRDCDLFAPSLELAERLSHYSKDFLSKTVIGLPILIERRVKLRTTLLLQYKHRTAISYEIGYSVWHVQSSVYFVDDVLLDGRSTVLYSSITGDH